MRRNISIVELIIIIALIAIIAKVVSYKRESNKTPALTSMVLIKGCHTGDFYIGKYEVTNKEYCQYAPNHANPGDNLPVVNVNWNDAVAYCKWLSNKTGKNYRLPTEKEWEYACRAGSTTDYYWGTNYVSEDPPPANIDDYCWYYKNSNNQVHPVGQKKPNNWGLYDMSGNVWEWCSDSYKDYFTPSGQYRVDRSGSWTYGAGGCQSGSRYLDMPDYRHHDLGFRLVMEP